jgi:Mrp family chromosome partitioning ATPase
MSKEEQRKLQNERIRRVAAGIDHKILVMSGKGGVGKSSVAVNLAVTLSNYGASVGLLDVDLHGPSVPRLLGLKGRQVFGDGERLVPLTYGERLLVVSIGSFIGNGDDAVIWRGPRKTGAIRLFISDVAWGELDYLVIDSPPGTGDEPMSVIEALPGARAVIVTTPQELALDDIRRSISFCRALGVPLIGVVENMSGLTCPQCGMVIDLFDAGGGEDVCEELDVPFLGRLPIEPEMVRSGDSGYPYMGRYRSTPAARAFFGIADSILSATSSRIEGNVLAGGQRS